jgi:hypothetical protein
MGRKLLGPPTGAGSWIQASLEGLPNGPFARHLPAHVLDGEVIGRVPHPDDAPDCPAIAARCHLIVRATDGTTHTVTEV